MNVYLIGYRCTGKTAVGKVLAEQLGWQFVDMDDEIVNDSGMTIEQIVKAHDWAYFRTMERAATRRLCARERLVVATGGGIVLDKQNVESMKKTGKIIWLAAKPATIRARLRQDKRSDAYRPPLTNGGVLDEIETVLLQRNPMYRAAMDIRVNTDTGSIEAICRQLVTDLAI